jgi:hypothetical protein
MDYNYLKCMEINLNNRERILFKRLPGWCTRDQVVLMMLGTGKVG